MVSFRVAHVLATARARPGELVKMGSLGLQNSFVAMSLSQ